MFQLVYCQNVVDILYKDSLKDEKNELTVYAVKLPTKKQGWLNCPSLLIPFFCESKVNESTFKRSYFAV